MNEKLFKNIIFDVILFLAATVIINLFKHQTPFAEIPWALLVIFIILILQQIPGINYKLMAGIFFVGILIFLRLNGGYVNWTSWVIYLVLDSLLTALFYFCGTHGWWQRHE